MVAIVVVMVMLRLLSWKEKRCRSMKVMGSLLITGYRKWEGEYKEEEEGKEEELGTKRERMKSLVN